MGETTQERNARFGKYFGKEFEEYLDKSLGKLKEQYGDHAILLFGKDRTVVDHCTDPTGRAAFNEEANRKYGDGNFCIVGLSPRMMLSPRVKPSTFGRLKRGLYKLFSR